MNNSLKEFCYKELNGTVAGEECGVLQGFFLLKWGNSTTFYMLMRLSRKGKKLWGKLQKQNQLLLSI